ncbi:hypothetical protein PmNV_016 [Penaeus monodon nudivirus]|uniref:Uncharacterized protein n=1 Tax=Penaeus monodon nudivirus TaxID=1529056 RepID=A0A076FEJ4_9VIRU|nr:hypothetical protein PmNV_016 [Penaeus monodon nudivirus]AII15804.1 hypothetical protein PmNV_016 [Penaeus monodon nudivirus]
MVAHIFYRMKTIDWVCYIGILHLSFIEFTPKSIAAIWQFFIFVSYIDCERIDHFIICIIPQNTSCTGMVFIIACYDIARIGTSKHTGVFTPASYTIYRCDGISRVEVAGRRLYGAIYASFYKFRIIYIIGIPLYD